MRKLLAIGLALLIPAVCFAQTTVPPKCVPGTAGSAAFRFNRFHGFNNNFLLNRLLLGNQFIGSNAFLGGYGGGFGSNVVLVPSAFGGGCAQTAAFIPQASTCCGQQIAVAPQFQQFAAPPVIAQPSCASAAAFTSLATPCSAGLGFNAGFGGYGVGTPLLGGGCGVNPAFVGGLGFNAGLGGFGGYGGFGGGILSNGFVPNLLSAIFNGGFGNRFGFRRFHR